MPLTPARYITLRAHRQAQNAALNYGSVMRTWHSAPAARRDRMALLTEFVAIVTADARRVF
jgi:hypothetical protein